MTAVDLDRRHPARRLRARRDHRRRRPARPDSGRLARGHRGRRARPADSSSSTSLVRLTRGYTFWSGVIGGAFLTTATHGTDQLMVQRYFCATTSGDARKALLWSGVVVFVQFVLFLLIGVMLYVYYTATRRPRSPSSRATAGSRPTASSPTSSSGTCRRVSSASCSPRSSPPRCPRCPRRSTPRRPRPSTTSTCRPRAGAQRRALPDGVAAAHRRLRPRADWRGGRRHLALQPRRRRGARHRIVHQRHDPRRLPARHVHAARGTARGVHRHPRGAAVMLSSSCSPR
jgi:hypothetical protein